MGAKGVEAIGATGADCAVWAASACFAAADAFAATTAPTEVVSITSSDSVDCGADTGAAAGVPSCRDGTRVTSAEPGACPAGSIETDIRSPARRMTTANTPIPAQS
jgi:hypothetical protein